MSLAKCKNGVVLSHPYEFANLQQENPHSRFEGGDLAALFAKTEQGLSGSVLIEVVPAVRPAYNKITQVVSETTPEFINGVLTQKFAVTSVLPDQAAANLITERARLVE